MATQFIGTANSVANTCTIPTHQSGDLIIIAASVAGIFTPPALGAGYTNIITATNSANIACRVGYRIATGSTHTSGTWTDATLMIAMVFRASGGITIGSSASDNTGTYPALTASSPLRSWLLRYGASNTSFGTDTFVAPPSFVNRDGRNRSNSSLGSHDSNQVLSAAAVASSLLPASFSVGFTIEIIGDLENKPTLFWAFP